MREALFNIIGENIVGSHFLDLFAGSGAIGLEAASRGAASVTCIEQDRRVLATIEHNAKIMELSQKVKLILADASKLGAANRKHDILFADPPYQSTILEASLKQLLAKGWLTEQANIIIECEAQTPFPKLDFAKIVDERRYGRGRLVFLQLLKR